MPVCHANRPLVAGTGTSTSTKPLRPAYTEKTRIAPLDDNTSLERSSLRFSSTEALRLRLWPVDLLRYLGKAARAIRRAREVDAPVSFAINQTRKSGDVHTYALRRSSLHVALRHGTTDVAAFDEVFIECDYDLPAPVVSRLGHDRLRVLDLGANVGLFAIWAFRSLPGCAVTSVEADPENFRVLRLAHDMNSAVPWTVIHAAAATVAGSVQFVSGKGTSSYVSAHPHPGAIAVPAIDVLPALDTHDFVKMDIEGSEWELLADPRMGQSRVRAMVVEYHGNSGTVESPSERASRLLHAAGFATTTPIEKTPELGVIWAYRS